jgi:hypothetical protein
VLSRPVDASPGLSGLRVGRLSERAFPLAGVALYAVADPSIRHAKHVHGCVSIDYSCSATHRRLWGSFALLDDAVIPG